MGLFKRLLGREASVVTVQPAGVSFEVRGNQSILEAALGQGIAYPHSCTVGTCGSCKSRLLRGRIREITNFAYVLSAAELQGGIILACQAAARGEVELEVAGLAAHRLHPAVSCHGEVVATRALAPDVLELTLALDGPLAFDAGQYAQLEVDEVHGARAYSFAVPPQPGGRSEVSFFVRHVPGGAFTDLLFSGALAGRRLRVHGPLGNFWLRESHAPMVCVAGGSGLAPLVALLEDAIARQVGRPCVLLFGARRRADLYALDRIEAIRARWNGAFSFVPVLSAADDDATWGGARGLVTEHIARAAQGLLSADAEGYLCGPPGMIDAAVETFTALGLAPANLHCDRFLDGSHGLHRHALAS